MPPEAIAVTRLLSDSVLEALTDLHARIPETIVLDDREVPTPAGPHQIAASIQALLAVTWPAGAILRNDRRHFPDWEFSFHDGEVDPGMIVEERPRHWFVIGSDEGQWYLLADLAEATADDDPPVYRVDHEGGETAPPSMPLRDRLRDLRCDLTPRMGFGRDCVHGRLDRVRAGIAEFGTGPLDDSGLTPLHLAVMSKSLETVQLLLDAGADPNAGMERMIELTESTYLSEEVDGDPYRKLFTDDSPLHVVIWNLWLQYDRQLVPEMAMRLLAAGADPNRASSRARERNETEGWSPTDVAFDTALHYNQPDRESRAGVDVLSRTVLEQILSAGGETVAYAGWDLEGNRPES